MSRSGFPKATFAKMRKARGLIGLGGEKHSIVSLVDSRTVEVRLQNRCANVPIPPRTQRKQFGQKANHTTGRTVPLNIHLASARMGTKIPHAQFSQIRNNQFRSGAPERCRAIDYRCIFHVSKHPVQQCQTIVVCHITDKLMTDTNLLFAWWEHARTEGAVQGETGRKRAGIGPVKRLLPPSAPGRPGAEGGLGSLPGVAKARIGPGRLGRGISQDTPER